MSPPVDVDRLVAALTAVDPAVLERDELVAVTGQIRQLKGWIAVLENRVTRRQNELADTGRAEAAANLHSRHGGQSSKDAHATSERETVCSAMPGFEDALATGTITSGHVDAVAAATKNLDESTRAEFHAAAEDLLADAARSGVDAFGRSCRDLARHLTARTGSDADELDRQRAQSKARRWVDKSTGMCHTHLELDPVRDRALWAAVDAERARLRQRDGNARTPWDQLTVNAVIAAVSGGGAARRVPEISVLIDYATMVSGLHEHSICETDTGTPLPVATVRRMACDAEVLPIVLDGDGKALDVGRSKRTATVDQRRALRAMHRTCVHPDCTVTFDACRIHHTIEWTTQHGPTNLDLLAPLCEQHHHLVHEGGWHLTLDNNRNATWTRPDGTTHHHGPTLDRHPTAA